eukprot:jgi/Antlo1/2259/2241
MASIEKLNIVSCDIQAGKIAECMQSLNLVKLNVSGNKNLSDKDWETVGRMTRLEKLNISGCNVKAGTIAKHMKKLNLVELDVSKNKSLSDEDWKRVGEMTRLERLNIRGCDVQEEFSRYLGGLRCCIVE